MQMPLTRTEFAGSRINNHEVRRVGGAPAWPRLLAVAPPVLLLAQLPAQFAVLVGGGVDIEIPMASLQIFNLCLG